MSQSNMRILIFRNLNVAVTCSDRQVPELQKSLATLLAEHIEKFGHNPEGVIIETQWGQSWRLFRTQDGSWNIEAPK